MSTIRVTLTMDENLLKRARRVSGDNFSRFVGDALKRRVDQIHRDALREALIARSIEGAEEDLEICREWAYVDAETAVMGDSK